jgi:radical SAM superfamily enzyme YgiQ (UPF0313 family)
MFLMWGYEGETLEDIEATVEHVKKSLPDVYFTTVAYPIMNTKYYERVADQVVMTRGWAEGTDRDFVVRGRHSRRYYSFADRWLRSAVEAARIDGDDPAKAATLRAEAAEARAGLAAAAHEVEA